MWGESCGQWLFSDVCLTPRSGTEIVAKATRWPSKIKPGSTSDLPWYFADFLPTACDLAGCRVPSGIDGISIVPNLFDRTEQQRRHEFNYWEFHEGRGSKQAVRMGSWKAVRKSPSASLQIVRTPERYRAAHDMEQEHPEMVTRVLPILKRRAPTRSIGHFATRRKRNWARPP